MKVLQPNLSPFLGKVKDNLRIPQKRVLRALMPANPADDYNDWPVLTRAQLGVKIGYTAISGTLTRALNGVREGSSSDSPFQGLLRRGLVKKVGLDGAEAYQITDAGRKAIEKLGELPNLKDKAGCTNNRYLSGETFEEIAADNGVVEAVEKSHARSQGFLLDSKLRKALEDHAMATAKRYFESKGYEVEDHHKDHPFDLHCTKKNETLHVEVKGTQTDGDTIILTSGEVEFARRHKGQMALFLARSIKVSGAGKIINNGKETVIVPWDVDAGCLKPISFLYGVAGNR